MDPGAFFVRLRDAVQVNSVIRCMRDARRYAVSCRHCTRLSVEWMRPVCSVGVSLGFVVVV